MFQSWVAQETGIRHPASFSLQLKAFEVHLPPVPCPRKSPAWVGPGYKGSGQTSDSSTNSSCKGSGLPAAWDQQCHTGWGFPPHGDHGNHSLQAPHLSPHTPEGLTHPHSF